MYPLIILLLLVGAVCYLASRFNNGSNHTTTAPNVVQRAGAPDITGFRPGDVELNAAVAEAQATTDTFLKVLAAPHANQNDFSVKHPFIIEEGLPEKEYIWIRDLSYDGKLLHGRIGNHPYYISNLKLDDLVSFPPLELSDWMYKEDGKVVGGYSMRVIRKRLSGPEAADFDRHIQFKD